MKTIEQKFIKWVNDLPEDIKIDYSDNLNCVVCRFYKEIEGVESISVGPSYYRIPIDSMKEISLDSNIIRILTISIIRDENNQYNFSNIITKGRLLNAIKTYASS